MFARRHLLAGTPQRLDPDADIQRRSACVVRGRSFIAHA